MNPRDIALPVQVLLWKRTPPRRTPPGELVGVRAVEIVGVNFQCSTAPCRAFGAVVGHLEIE